MTVPGAFHGWCTLIDKYGSLPLKDILAEAIRYAEDGFPVSEVIAGYWRSGTRHQGVPEFAKNYLVREGDQWRSPRLGEIFRQPDLGRTFRELAAGGQLEAERRVAGGRDPQDEDGVHAA